MKQFAEGLLGYPSIVRARLGRRRESRLILAYHNVIAGNAPLAEGERSLHLPLESFKAQLDAIGALGLRVVPLDSPIEPGAPTIAITFDDAYAGALHNALPELLSRGWPSTIFVAPGLLGSAAPWWDLLADPAQGSVPNAIRGMALMSFEGDGAVILASAASRGWPIFDAAADHRIGTEEELARAVRQSPLLTLGAHTWGHPNVTVLAPNRLEYELSRSLHWLESRYGHSVIPWLAYPYGLESPGACQAARRVGFKGALRVDGGWARPTDDPMRLPRVNLPLGLSPAGFRLRIAGFV